MIYLKNIRDLQTVYIPRSELLTESYVMINNCGEYKEGYKDGIDVGVNMQKSKLESLSVIENGTYMRTDGWDVVFVDVPEVVGKTQEKTLIVTKDNQVVHPDDGYDALTKVVVNATNYGQSKRNEGYSEGYTRGEIKGYEDGVKIGYDNGYADGKADSQGVTLVGLKESANWEDRDNNDCLVYDPKDYGADGFDFVSISIDEVYNQGKADGANKFTLKDTGIKLSHSTFVDIPLNVDFKGVTDFSDMFKDCAELTSARLTDTSSATDMNHMFDNCQKLIHVDDFDTSNVLDMGYMFSNCHNLTQIPHFDTSNVVNMIGMFSYSHIETIPPLQTSRVENMSYMFDTCVYLESIPLIDTSSVTDFKYMFRDCSITRIPHLDLIGDGIRGRSCRGMFKNCINLTEIPELSFGHVYDINELFYDCKSLVSIPKMYLPNLMFRIENLFGDEDLPNLTDVGGFIDLKVSIKDENGLARLPNLTYESCLNILNGLYDFVRNGENINSMEQGHLRVHQNFLNTVGDKISIATKKGWRITT